MNVLHRKYALMGRLCLFLSRDALIWSTSLSYTKNNTNEFHTHVHRFYILEKENTVIGLVLCMSEYECFEVSKLVLADKKLDQCIPIFKLNSDFMFIVLNNLGFHTETQCYI